MASLSSEGREHKNLQRLFHRHIGFLDVVCLFMGY